MYTTSGCSKPIIKIWRVWLRYASLETVYGGEYSNLSDWLFDYEVV